MNPAIPDVQAALKAAESLVASLKAFDGSAGKQLALLRQVDGVRHALESPYDVVTNLVHVTTLYGALYTLANLNIFMKLPLPTSEEPAVTVDQLIRNLAGDVDVDASVIERSLRCAVSAGILEEVVEGANTTSTDGQPRAYRHNRRSLAFLPHVAGNFLRTSVDFALAKMRLPEYVRSHAARDLTDPKKSPFAWAFGKEGKTYYEIIEEDAEYRKIWDEVMQKMEKNMPVKGMFPFEVLKEQVEMDLGRPFVVDIGGGRGRALLAIMEDLGGSYGAKMVLQDLPIVIDAVSQDDIPGVEKMAYDMFTPQPIKGKVPRTDSMTGSRLLRTRILTSCRRARLPHETNSS